MSRRKIFITCLFLTLRLLIFAQDETYRLKGKIVDEMGKSIPDVNIVNVKENHSVLTDENGFFKIECKPSDYYYIAILHMGYETKKIKIKNGDNNILINLTSKYSELPEVVVDGEVLSTLREKMNFLNQKNSNPTINNNIESLLVTMGGVNSNNELSNEYNVRGGNFDENVIYINGIEVKKPFLIRNAQQEGLSFINPLMVNQIDFSRGGFTAEYGDKMSSVLDIGYKKTENKFEGNVYGSFTEGGVYIGSSTSRFSSVSSIRYKTTSKILNTSDTKGEYKPQFANMQTFMNLNLSDNLDIFILGNYDDSKFEMFPQDRETKFGTMFNPKTYYVKYSGKEDDNYMTYQGTVGLKYKIVDKLNLSFSATFFGTKENEKLDIASQYQLMDNDLNNASSGLYHEYFRNRLQSNIKTFTHTGAFSTNNHEIKWGADFQYENIKDHLQEWNRIGTTTENSTSGNDLTMNYSLFSENKIKTNRYSGFLQDTYRIYSDKGSWTFNLGFRLSHWEFNNETLFSPRGTIAFIPKGNKLVFRASSGIYYQSPFYKEVQQMILGEDNVYSIVLNKNIKSQKSIHFILGNDYYFRSGDNKLKLTSELFYKKLSDLNPYTVDNQKIHYLGENIGSGYIIGADFRLFGEFIKGVDSWVSLSLMKTSQKFDDMTLPLSSDQRYNISFFLQDYMPGYERLAVSIKGVFADGLPFYSNPLRFSNKPMRYPAYKRIDLGFTWQVLREDFDVRNRSKILSGIRDISLGLDFFNILDIKNTNNYYWITDNSGAQYAVPNYLTGRMINLKFSMSF